MNFIKNHGIAMVSVLMLTTLIAMFTVSMVFISTNYLQMMGNIEDKTRALEAAEAVAECALAELNLNPTWGIDRKTGDNMLIELAGAKGSITFSGSEYLSYNNLKGKTVVNRSTIGDGKLTKGTIPAFTAELICKGEAGKTVKYVKAIFVRDDIYPYSLNSQGKIIFDGTGAIDIRGYSLSGAIMPGNFHSNWNGDGNSIEQLNKIDIVNAHGGTASAAGSIALNNESDLTKVRIKENLGKDGIVDFEKMDIDKKIMDPNQNEYLKSAKSIGSGTFLITPLLYIPDVKSTMVKILNTTYLSKKLLTSIKGNQELNNDLTNIVNNTTKDWKSVRKTTTSYTSAYTDAEGVTQDIRRLNQGTGYGPKGWDTIRGTTISAIANVNIEGTKEETRTTTTTDEAGNVHTETYTVEVGANGSGSVAKSFTPSQLGMSESGSSFTLSPYNIIYWATTNEPSDSYIDESDTVSSDDANTPVTVPLQLQPILESLIGSGCVKGQEDIGLAQLDTDSKVTRFYPSGYDEFGISSNFTVSADGVIDGEFRLTKDLYINSADASPVGIQKTLNALVTDDYKTARQWKITTETDLGDSRAAARTDADIFRIMGFAYNLNGKTYKVDASMDMNGKSIYSNANLILGVKVEGEGAMISKGKIAFLHKGIESSNLTCIAKDDLIIQTVPGSKYKIKGYLYSADDVSIEGFDPLGALAGAVIIPGSDDLEPNMYINGSIIGLNCNTGTDNYGNESIRIKNDKNKIFTYGSYGWSSLTSMRGGYFHVRRMSWFELN